mmetsp:Transcript_55576/g.136212  ORF Transcript_55576/g.136212 Transcript_55576/m.136212 type:complete len:297 (+) Transcript_55576:152-1042(+)
MLPSLKGFKPSRVLQSNPKAKSVVFLGEIEGKEGQAIVYLEKKPFNSERAEEQLAAEPAELSLDFNNAEYSVYEMLAKAEMGAIKCDVIHPATAKHIAKYSREEFRFFRETAGIYRDVTLPYVLREEMGGRIEWVYNVLEKKKEADRILCEDSDPKVGFILAPDMKWDQKSIGDLYCLAIVNRRDIPSLRALTPEHVPLLRNVYKKGCACMKEKYGVDEGSMRVYVHYLPTFYHLHVHFTHVDFEAGGQQAGKAHLLADIINNIEMRGDYYQAAALTVQIKTSLGLYKEFEAKGLV